MAAALWRNRFVANRDKIKRKKKGVLGEKKGREGRWGELGTVRKKEEGKGG